MNISIFQESLQMSPQLLQQAIQFMNQLNQSPENIHDLMEAAQAGQDEEVDKITNQASGDLDVKTSYTPMSVTFRLTHDDIPCCTLTLNLIWG